MNLDFKTLVILIPGFPESEEDSTCLPIQQLFVLSLKKLYPGLNITIFSFQYPYHTKKYEWFGIPVIPFSGKNKGGLLRWLLRKKIYTELLKLHQANAISGILSFWCTECALVGNKFAGRQGIRHICWIRGQDARKGNRYVKKINPQPADLAVLSDFLQEEFEKNYSIRPAHVIPPGIDIKKYALNKLPRDLDILAAGSLISLKQYSLFPEIIFELKKNIPSIKAMLCGKGPEQKNLELKIKKFGLEKNIVLTGELPYPDILRLMQQSRLFLHPSSYEGFSGVCLEALHAGAHVISFCKAMNHEIEHWHIVESKEKMIHKALEILQNTGTKFTSVTPYTAEDSAIKMMQLFTR
ncbi:MAG TPA: glycosyltransferase family 4 protein [Chitinophagaceae bacterium]|nr:glycosyltransferase family 4 protein [Chitinophagaceae bacterium]